MDGSLQYLAKAETFEACRLEQFVAEIVGYAADEAYRKFGTTIGGDVPTEEPAQVVDKEFAYLGFAAVVSDERNERGEESVGLWLTVCLGDDFG